VKITHDYFLTEWHGFRKIMCSTEYTPDQKFDAWAGLLRVYFLCPFDNDENEEARQMCIGMLTAEFPMRMGLEMSLRLEQLFDTGQIAKAFGDTEALEYMFEPKVSEGDDDVN